MRKKVIVVATSFKSKGGINSVIISYTKTKLWIDWECYWLETHSDKSKIQKLFILLKGLIKFVLIIPKYSIVHIHLSEPYSALRKFLFLKIACIFKKRIIIHFHSFSPETTISGKFQSVYYKLFSLADKILVLSSVWKFWIIRKWPELTDKIDILYNPCPSINFENNIKKSRIILYAGELNSRKGYNDLINGFAKVASRNNEWKLVFAGNGDIEKARRMALDLNIENQVVFKGWVSGSDKDELLRNASIFCLPSYAEGFPMSVLEAWAYYIPVITTLVGGLSDIVIDGVNALVIKPGDIDQIAIAIEKLIQDVNLRDHICNGGLLLSNSIFNLEEKCKQLDLIYSSLLDS
jgi:glycosyltransferase involved in cell wall biosynthesis